jgi:hypothetical protein
MFYSITKLTKSLKSLARAVLYLSDQTDIPVNDEGTDLNIDDAETITFEPTITLYSENCEAEPDK